MDDLRALANYAASLYRRRLLDGESRSLSADEKKHLAHIRQAVLDGDVMHAMELLVWEGWFRDYHLLFLRRLFPLLSSDEQKALGLKQVWQHMKGCGRQGLALQLFREAAPGFKSSIPQSWPTAITVYRGTFDTDENSMSHARLWRRVQRQIRHGIAWTIDRKVALEFGGVDMTRRDVSSFGKGEQVVRGFGSATVSSHDVLAYMETFMGKEMECIIDPQRISRVTYEEITTPITDRRIRS
jgi:hypothetical protein